jgi:ribosomal-protein-alanine N-acetyltransferase
VTVPPGERLRLVVAPMRQRDLKAVLRIEGQVFDEPWSRRLFEGELAQRASRAYRAAWVDSELVGYAGQMSIDDEAHVNNIAVAPGWEGRRIGTVLLYDLVHTALARGSAHLTLEVAVGNEPAIALYRRFGLAPVGVRPNYYQDGDALIMWVRDIDSDAYAERLAAIGASLSVALDLERRD